MWDNTIGKMCGRGNRNLLLANLAILVACGLWFWGSYRAIYNEFAGPQWVSADALGEHLQPWTEFRYHYAVDNAQLTKPVYLEERVTYNKKTNQETSRELLSVYQLMKVGKALMLVKAGQPVASPCKIGGALVACPEQDRKQVVAMAGEIYHKDISADLLPVMLDTQRFGSWGAAGGIFFVSIPALLALWNLKKYMVRRDDFMANPVANDLKLYGDPRELVGAIEGELRDTANVHRSGFVTISKNWILCTSTWGVRVRHLDDLVWAYKHELTRSVYFVPVSKEHSIYLIFADKSKFSPSGSAKNSEKILEILMERAPWAIYGYSDQLAQQWSKAPDVMLLEVKNARAKIKEEARKGRQAGESAQESESV